MSLLGVMDTGSSGSTHDGGDYAINLYECGNCMTIAKESVWDHPGVVWVYPDNTTEVVSEKE
jgi:hypothetical protein